MLISVLILVFYNIAGAFQDSNKKLQDSVKPDKQLMIDTGQKVPVELPDSGKQLIPEVDTAVLIVEQDKSTLTNSELFIYILLSVGGLALFFFIFVHTLFRTFHKSRSTRQSLILSWNLFFLVSLIWIFIIWGIVANFWTVTSFFFFFFFLILVSLTMLIIAIKTRN